MFIKDNKYQKGLHAGSTTEIRANCQGDKAAFIHQSLGFESIIKKTSLLLELPLN